MDSARPIFIQIIEMIEDDILSAVYREDDLIISTPQISKLLSVNPTTAQKAIGILTDRGVLYKKRGIGMAVAPGAQALILSARQADFFARAVPAFIAEARKIGISDHELLQIVKENLP